MYRQLHVGMHSDVSKIILAIAAVSIMVTVAFASASSDSSDAADTDCKTYYYSQISEYGKAIYDAVPSATFGIDSDTGNTVATVTIDMSAYAGEPADDVAARFSNGMSEALACFAMEKVGCYWVGGQWKVSTKYSQDSEGKLTGGTVTVIIYGVVTDYGNTNEQVTATMASVQTALNNISVDETSRYTKVKSIHEQVCRILDYDDAMPDGAGCRNIATALIGTHSVVCEGYAKLFKALCDLHDVPCLIVTGEAVTNKGTEGHMWNYVQMDDDKWYLVDCTWDDQDYDGTDPSDLRTNYLLAGTDTDGFYRKVSESHFPTTTPLDGSSVEFTLETLNKDKYASEKFAVEFLNIDGTSCASSEYSLGDIVNLDVSDPTYSDDKVGTYTFKEWNTSQSGTGTTYMKGTTVVTGPMSFYALYNIDYKNYTYTFDLCNGTTPITKDYNYGDAIEIPTGVTKASDEQHSYVFRGWTDIDGNPTTPDAKAVSTAVVYKAYYSVTYTLTGYSDSYLLSSADLTNAKADGEKLIICLSPGDKVLARFTFDKTALNTLSSDTISVTKIPFSDLSSSVQNKLNSATVYRIDFGSNNDVFSAGSVSVSLAYDDTGNLSGNIQLYYVNGDSAQNIPCTYGNGMVNFETNHFSDYAVRAIGLNSDLSWYYPIFIILIVAFIGMAVAYKFS